MKKLFLIACTLVMGAALSFGQATTGTPDKSGDTSKTTTTGTKTGKKSTKTKAHKGGKKSKKSSDSTTTPQPK